MLRSLDSIEERGRRIIVDAANRVRGRDLKEWSESLKISAKSRIPNTQLGWYSAFMEYPFSIEVETLDGSATFIDVEHTVPSHCPQINSMNIAGRDSSGEVAWSPGSPAELKEIGSPSWYALDEPEARLLIQNGHKWSAQVSNRGRLRTAKDFFSQTSRESIEHAFRSLVNNIKFSDILIEALGDLRNITPDKLKKVIRVSDRLSGTEDSTITHQWKTYIVAEVMQRVSDDGWLDEKRTLGELLGLQKVNSL